MVGRSICSIWDARPSTGSRRVSGDRAGVTEKRLGRDSAAPTASAGNLAALGIAMGRPAASLTGPCDPTGADRVLAVSDPGRRPSSGWCPHPAVVAFDQQ